MDTLRLLLFRAFALLGVFFTGFAAWQLLIKGTEAAMSFLPRWLMGFSGL